FNGFKQNSPYGSTFASIATQPSWVWKIPFTCAMLVLCVPLAVFALAALLTFLILFSALSLLNRVLSVFSSPRSHSPTRTSGGDGRENVRVIHPHE
ncbi:MAG: hypothetical protein ACYTGQ_06790, partial [Planctomycetota bacterium]